MRIVTAATLLLVAFISTPSLAQIVGIVPGNNYLAVAIPRALLNGGGACDGGYCVSTGQGVPLDTYATSTGVADQFAMVNGQIASVNNSLAAVNNQIADTNNGFRRQTSFAAAVGAMRDATPNEATASLCAEVFLLWVMP